MTLAEMRAAVQRQLDRAGAPSTEDTDVDRWVNQAIREFLCSRHNWAPMEAEYEAPTVADQHDYTVPNPDYFKDFAAIEISDDGDSFVELEEISAAQYRQLFPDRTRTGKPYSWCRFGDTGFVLGPTPDVSTYTLRSTVWEYPAELTTDSATNRFTQFYTHLVEQFAVAVGYGFYFDESRFQGRLSIATRELDEAIKNDRNRLAPSRQTAVPSRSAGIVRSNLGSFRTRRRGRYLTGG